MKGVIAISLALLFLVQICWTKNDKEKKQYHILTVAMCLKGHFNPASGVVRALTNAGHKVTVFAMDECPDMVKQYMPNITAYHDEVVLQSLEMSPDPFKILPQLDEFFREKCVNELYEHLDKLLSTSETKFDAMFTDFLAAGSLLAAEKYNLPTITQYMSPLLPTVSKSTLGEMSALPIDNPEDTPGMLQIFGSLIFLGLYDVLVSIPNLKAINEIRQANGWDPYPYGCGYHPFGYNHANTVLIAQGSQPILGPEGEGRENLYPIGFVPDSIMYPELTPELAKWLEKSTKPTIFISLGTVVILDEQSTKTLFQQFTSQDKFNIIWAVRKTMMKYLSIETNPYISDQLFMGTYLPQGKILQHPAVKLFVTHCGANSVQDSVYAMKPMITFPGFGDQPLQSNALIKLGVAKRIRNFIYPELENLVNYMLEEPRYTQMVEKLRYGREQSMKLGGYKKGVEIIEDVIEGRVKANFSVAPEDVTSAPVIQARIALGVFVLLAATILLALVFIVVKLALCCKGIMFGTSKTNIKKD